MSKNPVVHAAYQEILDGHVEPFLSGIGFEAMKSKKWRGWFLRWEGDCLWRIALGLYGVIGGAQPEAGISISVCIGFGSLAEFLEPAGVLNPYTFDRKKPCAMAAGLRNLPRPGVAEHAELMISQGVNTERLGQSAIAEIREYGLPYFEKYGDINKALAAWEAGDTHNLASEVDYYVAATSWLRGENRRAVSFIRDSISYYEKQFRERGRNQDKYEIEDRLRFIEYLESRRESATTQ